MSIENLRPLEKRALFIVREGQGKYTWYQVARVLPVYDYPAEEHNASKILRRLESMGLLKSCISEGVPSPRYDITETGLRALEEN